MMRMSAEVRDVLNFDRDDEKRNEQSLTSKFNEEQMNTFKEINKSVEEDEGKCFYLNGAGGCGKTTVVKPLLHEARSRGEIALACVSSGISTTLLSKGQTAPRFLSKDCMNNQHVVLEDDQDELSC